MSIINAQPIAAVATPKSLSYTVSLTAGLGRRMRSSRLPQTEGAGADARHALLLLGADMRAGCGDGGEVAIDQSALPYRRSLQAHAVATPVRAERQGADQRGDQ